MEAGEESDPQKGYKVFIITPYQGGTEYNNPHNSVTINWTVEYIERARSYFNNVLFLRCSRGGIRHCVAHFEICELFYYKYCRQG